MRFSLVALAAVLALGGCSQKGAFDLFTMDEAHERSVEQLRTASIVKSMETKAIVSAVYLNPVYPGQYRDGEYFMAAFYFEKRNQDVKKWSLEDHGYTLTLNVADVDPKTKKPVTRSLIPVSMEEIKENDPRRSLIPIQNNWNRYFLIRFDPVNGPGLALRLENNQTGTAVLNYQKSE